MNNNILGPSIKQLRLSKKMTQTELSRLTGFSQNTISNHENGNRNLDETQIAKYAEALGTTPQGLYDVYLANQSKNDKNSSETIFTIYQKLNKSRQQKVYDFASDQLAEQNNSHKNNIAKFPSRNNDEQTDYDIYSDIKIYGAASAGPGEVLMDEHTETVTYHGFVPKHDYALVVNGNSMEPLFADQQVIFVDKTEEAYNGQIVIAFLNGNAYVKKLWISSDKCELVSLNPDYAPIEITENDDFCIDGVVVL
ncbi:MAG TPA: XRE family transcriptional regulator [Lapidilactobacillus dextrinicus]|uniref:XRE family transcriptional regulator n=1 Tax=Lapidilactobacillus dextrinicus TaxID=51664 RepID=A0A921DVH7_9LACO|nr:XRE family transcriptional regulator [Lapidilactobacillus dextrinicus]